MNALLKSSLLLSLTTFLPAATLTVGPGGMFPDVATALANASSGDLILVSPGTYGPFIVNIPVTIAGNGGTWTVTQGSGAAIKISAAGTVAIDSVVINFASLSGPAISIVGCSKDVRLRNVTVNAAANLNGTAARAAIEVSDSADVILENVSVGISVARSARTLFPDGLNTGVSALRCKDSLFVLRNCNLRGYDATPGSGFAGDAIRVITTGTLPTQSCWLLTDTSTTLRGGDITSGPGNAGNCLHQIGSGALLIEVCLAYNPQPGTGGTLAGGEFAINNDGGVIPNGPRRSIPGCATQVSGTTNAPATVANGSALTVTVSSGVGNACSLGMSLGSRYTHPVAGVNGRLLLDQATLTTIGFGTTPATFIVTIPANPALVGTQTTYQGTLYGPAGGTGAFLIAPAFVAVR